MSLTIKDIISNLWTDIKTYISQNYQPKGSYASSNHNHNTAYLGISAKAESAKSADSVTWANVSGKPSTYTPSSHTHDDRYYTESEIDTKLNGKSNTNHTHSNYLTSHQDISGKANTSGTYSGLNVGYASSSGNADTLDGYHHDSFPKTSAALFTVDGLGSPGWSAIGTGTGGSCIQVRTTDNTYPSICFHRSGHSHCVLAESGGQLGTMQQGNGSFNHLITSANIGSQSVNYANSAGAVAWANVSGKPSSYTPSSHTHDDRYYTESEIDTKLNGKSNTNHTHSNYLTGITKAMVTNALGYTPPTTNTTYSKLSQFTNDSGYITSSGSCNYANSAGEAAYMGQRNTINYGVDRLQYYNLSTSTTSGATANANPTNDWYYHLLMSHANSSGYYGDMALCFHQDTLAFRRIAGGSDQGWTYLIKQGKTIVSGYEVYVG